MFWQNLFTFFIMKTKHNNSPGGREASGGILVAERRDTAYDKKSSS